MLRSCGECAGRCRTWRSRRPSRRSSGMPVAWWDDGRQRDGWAAGFTDQRWLKPIYIRFADTLIHFRPHRRYIDRVGSQRRKQRGVDDGERRIFPTVHCTELAKYKRMTSHPVRRPLFDVCPTLVKNRSRDWCVFAGGARIGYKRRVFDRSLAVGSEGSSVARTDFIVDTLHRPQPQALCFISVSLPTTSLKRKEIQWKSSSCSEWRRASAHKATNAHVC